MRNYSFLHLKLPNIYFKELSVPAASPPGVTWSVNSDTIMKCDLQTGPVVQEWQSGKIYL